MAKTSIGPEIAQIAFVVRDIEAAKLRFSELFNVEAPATLQTGPQEETGMRYRGELGSAGAKLAIFQFANLSIELIEPIGDESAWAEGLKRYGEGFHHLAIRAPDADAHAVVLEGQGWNQIQQGNFPGGRYIYLDAASPFNCLLEVLSKR